MTERSVWKNRLKQAVLDLEELGQQIVDGEIPESTGEKLRRNYLAEITEARGRLDESSVADEESSNGDQRAPTKRRFWNRGRIVVLALLGTAAVTLVISVGWFAQTEVTATQEEFDPSQYSNETMEAVIAANSDHQAINGMRLALAARYVQAGDYPKAFVHYREVLEKNPTNLEEAEALGRLGWMAWAGSGETQLALRTLDRALTALPGDPQNLYFKAIVLWCGAGQPQDAAFLLEQVAEALPSDPAVTSDLQAARSGEECQ